MRQARVTAIRSPAQSVADANQAGSGEDGAVAAGPVVQIRQALPHPRVHPGWPEPGAGRSG